MTSLVAQPQAEAAIKSLLAFSLSKSEAKQEATNQLDLLEDDPIINLIITLSRIPSKSSNKPEQMLGFKMVLRRFSHPLF